MSFLICGIIMRKRGHMRGMIRRYIIKKVFVGEPYVMYDDRKVLVGKDFGVCRKKRPSGKIVTLITEYI